MRILPDIARIGSNAGIIYYRRRDDPIDLLRISDKTFSKEIR